MLPAVSNPRRPGPARDLLELSHGQHPDLAAVVLAELGEQHRADRDVDADPEGVGPADQLQQPLLGELLDEQPVLGEQAGVVDTDAGFDEPAKVLSDRGVEAEAADRFAHRFLLLAGENVEAGEALGPGGGVLAG